jgi:hypothetical protein
MVPARRSRRWVWFFVAVSVLAVAAIIIQVRVNQALQLKPEALEKAWALWKEKGPADYELVYTVQKPGAEADKIEVRVRHKKTVGLTINGRPAEARLFAYYGMDELFNQISEFLRKDAEPGKPRAYVRGEFDPQDGHIEKFVRSVMGTQERVEIHVLELRPLAKGGK